MIEDIQASGYLPPQKRLVEGVVRYQSGAIPGVAMRIPGRCQCRGIWRTGDSIADDAIRSGTGKARDGGRWTRALGREHPRQAQLVRVNRRPGNTSSWQRSRFHAPMSKRIMR